jgi:hypothetical protein
MAASRTASALTALLCLTVAVGALLDRAWRLGEVFSPADAIFQFYPWSYDAPYTTGSNLSRTDEAFYHQPLVQTHWPRLRRGDWPDLDPQVLSGVPGFFQGLAAGQAFSPLSLPFYLAPPGLAVTLYAMLRLLLGGFFMFLFLRARGCRPEAAIAGGLVFVLSGGFITWLSAPIPTVALWLPLAWLLVDRLIHDRPRARDAAWLAIVLACIWLGAYLPTALVCVAVIGAYAVAGALEARAWRPLAASVAAGAASLLVAAAGLWPMLANLLDSAAAGRTMGDAHPGLDVLVTFAMPDFFGDPSDQTWWRPGTVQYPELVAYVGVVSLVLAGAGVVAARPAEPRWRAWFFAGVAVTSLGIMYGWPPFDWVNVLPGLRQTNPMRWSVALAAAVAVLAAYGIDGLTSGRAAWRGGFAGALLMTAALSLLAILVFVTERPTIRALGLQALEWRQLFRFAALATGALALVAAPIVMRGRIAGWAGAATALGWAAAAIVAVDLLSFGRGFNPTLPPERLYPAAPALDVLARELGDGRVAPVGGPDAGLLEGHVFSTYALPTITGFDYRGDAAYQRFIARADGNRRFDGPRWAHVGLSSTDALDLRLLGLLGAGLIVTSPLDHAPQAGAFAPIPELVDGRMVRQPFVARRDGLRRVDVLTATYRRINAGTLTMRVVEDAGRVVAERTVAAAEVRDNDWLTLEFDAVSASKGGRFAIELVPRGAREGSGVTAWGVHASGQDVEPVVIDGQPTSQALFYRAFGADARLGDAPLVYARDLNVYRNPYARPRAWFVSRAEVQPADAHLDRLSAGGFDAAREVLIDQPLPAMPAPTARVLSIDLADPDRRDIGVEAPDGGVLVVSERAAAGWSATVDGREAPLVRANAVLMALAVPPGAERIVLTFRQPWVREGAAVSVLALAIALSVALRRAAGAR